MSASFRDGGLAPLAWMRSSPFYPFASHCLSDSLSGLWKTRGDEFETWPATSLGNRELSKYPYN